MIIYEAKDGELLEIKEKEFIIMENNKNKIDIAKERNKNEIADINKICELYGVTYDYILTSASRKAMKAKREIAKFFINKGYGYNMIVPLLGYKTHASIVYLLKDKKGNIQ